MLLLLLLLPRQCKGLVFLHAPPANGASLCAFLYRCFLLVVTILAIIDRICNGVTSAQRAPSNFFYDLPHFFQPLGGHPLEIVRLFDKKEDNVVEFDRWRIRGFENNFSQRSMIQFSVCSPVDRSRFFSG